MAGFKTHITVSTACGVAYGWYGCTQLDLPLPACELAGGLCSVSGMLPDLDSDSGVPARESISFAAAVIPMLMIQRMANHGLTVEQMVLAGGPLYLVIRFGVGTLLKKLTVHRGMFHSVPALIIAAMIAFLICDTGMTSVRLFKAGAVAIGFLSHLVLDEIWSVNLTHSGPTLKKSFGTALKFFGPSSGANSAAYGLLILTSLLVFQDLKPTAVTSRIVRPADTTEEEDVPVRHATRHRREAIYE
jgi:hypothetical protein